MCITFS